MHTRFKHIRVQIQYANFEQMVIFILVCRKFKQYKM
jgi:hypothetical protein